jgi:type VI secretion system protein ImpK
MREEIASLVYPVLTQGIRLKDRLAAGEELDFGTAQKELLGLLQTTGQAQRWADFGGDNPSTQSLRSSDQFLGIRYALTCWLDEIFILDSPWKDQWRDSCLEGALYGDVERAWRFWAQADKASARPSTDGLEVYFLCVVLGFRGDKADTPEEIKNWCERVKAQLEQGQGPDFSLPVEGQPRTFVPPLTGARSMQSIAMFGGAAMLILIPVLVFFLVSFLGR